MPEAKTRVFIPREELKEIVLQFKGSQSQEKSYLHRGALKESLGKVLLPKSSVPDPT